MFHLSKSKHINFARLMETADSFLGLIPELKRQRRIKRIYRVLKLFCLSVVALFLILLILFSAEILSFTGLYGQAVSGKANLEQAIVFSKQNKFGEAIALARAAENNFNVSIDSLDQIKNNQFIGRFSFVASQFNGLESLLVSARFLSKAVYGGAGFGKSLESSLSGDKKLNFFKIQSGGKA